MYLFVRTPAKYQSYSGESGRIVLLSMWGDEVRILGATGAKTVDTKDGAEPPQLQMHDPTARVRYGVPQNEECMSLTAHRGVCTGAADQSDKTCARDSAGQR